jgi:hypothetical protein
MKTHKLADQLELLAKLLRSLPDSEFDEAILDLLSLIGDKNQSTKTRSRSPQPLPEGVDERLRTMTPVEIEKYLGSEVEPFSSAQLQDIAMRLGISTSKRQSKNALVNLITRHFEASQMDSIIRSSRKEESQQ